MSLLKFNMSSQKAGITGIPRVAEWITCFLPVYNGMWNPYPQWRSFAPLVRNHRVQVAHAVSLICKRSFLLGVVRFITIHHNKMHRNEIFNHYTTTTTKKYTKNNLTFSPLR